MQVQAGVRLAYPGWLCYAFASCEGPGLAVAVGLLRYGLNHSCGASSSQGMDLFFESSFKPPHLQPSQGPRRRVCLRGSMMVMCEVALQSEISTLKRRQAAPVKFLRTGSQSLPTQAGCAGFAVCKQPVILDCGSVQPKHCSALRPTCVSCPPKALSSCPMWCSPQRHVPS